MLVLVLAACGKSREATPEATANASTPSTKLGPAVQVVIERERVCARLASGRIACWGALDGKGRTARTPRPQLIDGLTDAIDLRLDGSDLCIRRKTGPAMCSTYNGVHAMAGSEGALALERGRSGWCILTAQHAIACRDGSGDDAKFVAVPGFTDIAAIASDIWYRCAVKTDGHVLCGGETQQLGMPAATAPAIVAGIEQAVAIVITDSDRMCARRADKQLACVGGIGATTPVDQIAGTCMRTGADVQCKNHPMFDDDYHPVSLRAAATDLACTESTCCVVAGGFVDCWGHNRSGELGDGAPIEDLPAEKVADLPPMAAIAAADRSIARTAEGKLYDWGGGSSRPSALLGGITVMFAGPRDEDDNGVRVAVAGHGRALRTVSGLYAFGPEISDDDPDSHLPLLPADLRDLFVDPAYGAWVALADGTTRRLDEERKSWKPIAGMRDVVKLSYGGSEVPVLFGMTTSGRVLAFEDDEHARVVTVPGVTTARELAGPLIVLADHSVVRIEADQDGHFTTTPEPTLRGLTQLGVGQTLLCGLAAGHVQCTHGDGKPAPLSPDLVATALAVGYEHACALDAQGAVWCWGSDANAALGRGRKVVRSEPAHVVDIGP